jgi:N-acetylglucosaminyl-diphospho-decaprenol L-rhamnosyltransferase
MLLDVDTAVGPSAVATLVRVLSRDPQVGLVGPLLTTFSGQLQYSCRRFPTLTTKTLRRFPSKISRRFLVEEFMLDWDHSETVPVDYVIGACQLIRTAALTQVGLLDERMFYGSEDADFCLRLRKAGWSVWYVPEAKVMHEQQRITKGRPFSVLTWRHVAATLKYFAKHRYWISRRKVYRQGVTRTQPNHRPNEGAE